MKRPLHPVISRTLEILILVTHPGLILMLATIKRLNSVLPTPTTDLVNDYLSIVMIFLGMQFLILLFLFASGWHRAGSTAASSA